MNHSAIETICTEINLHMRQFDLEQVKQTKAWAQRRLEELNQFRASERYHRIKSDAIELAKVEMLLCGGAAWHAAFEGRTRGMIDLFIERYCYNGRQRRTDSMRRRLGKMGIVNVHGNSHAREDQTLALVFQVETERGMRILNVRSQGREALRFCHQSPRILFALA